MFEEFGGRDADPLDAYLGEVETSQIYVGILGQSYGRPLPTRFSATHTEFRHAEQQGLRMAVWALATQRREGPQQSFLDEVRAFHVVPAFRSPADLERQVGERLRGIAAEDLAPWTKLGSIVFRATKVVHAGNEVTVTARVHSDDVAHALETAAPNDFGAGEEYRFTWAGRCRRVRVASIGSTTTTARSRLMQLQLEIVDGHQDNMLEVSLADMTRRWCMNRNWPATILTQRLLTYRYRTTLARQGPSSDLGCCMRAAPRPFALLACALEGQCR